MRLTTLTATKTNHMNIKTFLISIFVIILHSHFAIASENNEKVIKKHLSASVFFDNYKIEFYQPDAFGAYCSESLCGEHGDRESEGDAVRILDAQNNIVERINNAARVTLVNTAQDNFPYLTFQLWSGGAHCCYRYIFYSTKPTLKKIGEINTKHTDDIKINENNGEYSFQRHDWNFAYWKYSFADSPAAKVILNITDDGIIVSKKGMKRNYTGEEKREIDQKAKKINDKLTKIKYRWPHEKSYFSNVAIANLMKSLGAKFGISIFYETIKHKDNLIEYLQVKYDFIGLMLDLIYSGNKELAWKFYDSSIPDCYDVKNSILTEFKEQLRKSSYWEDISTL